MAEADRLLETHGIGKAQAPANPAAAELFRSFCERAETAPKALEVENHFFAGYGKSELDWSRPVHGILGDFKGDSMQMGMLLQRLEACKEQYIFLGNPPPFNGGWHFTALDDFEHPTQKDLDPSWRNIRIWHKVNYVASQTEKGEVALVPKEEFDPKNKHQGAIAISSTFKLATIFLTGGLMPHTLNATLLADNSDAAALLLKHLELKTRVAAIGHGLDVLLALGAVKGFEAAHFPNQEHLLRINGLQPSGSPVCACAREGLELVTAGFWGQATAEPFFAALGLGSAAAEPRAADVGRAVRVRSTETAFCWDAGKLQQLKGTCITGDPAAPTVAVLVDDVADPIEAYTMIDHLIQLKFNAHLISHSQDERSSESIRRVKTETVWGNAMYALKDCCCEIPTLPANLVAGTKFDAFFVAGGQCPYLMLKDPSIRGLVDGCAVGAAVCHGPEALIGTKWLHPADGQVGSFVSYYGAWMSFRDLSAVYERKKPGETCESVTPSGRLFTGNAPNATKAMMEQACQAILASR